MPLILLFHIHVGLCVNPEEDFNVSYGVVMFFLYIYAFKNVLYSSC